MTALRPLQADDIPFVVRIEAAASAHPWSEGQFRAELEKANSRSWVAVEGAEIRGFIVAWRVAEELQVAELAVDAAHRRRGLGRRLLLQVCEKAREEGLDRVTLEVGEGNRAARSLYASEGFVVTFRRPRFYGPKEAALLMEKTWPRAGEAE